jgi:hypothetical protein
MTILFHLTSVPTTPPTPADAADDLAAHGGATCFPLAQAIVMAPFNPATTPPTTTRMEKFGPVVSVV